MPSLQHRHTLVAVKRIHAQPVSHCRADLGTEPCQLLRERYIESLRFDHDGIFTEPLLRAA